MNVPLSKTRERNLRHGNKLWGEGNAEDVARCMATIVDLREELGEARACDSDALMVSECNHYRALAERRRAILKAAYDLINYREHAFYAPEVSLDTYLYQLHNWLDWALPAIDAEEARKKAG